MEKLSFAQQTCVRKSGLALQKTAAIWPGCRIGIAVSGGVDSMVLLKIMQLRQKIVYFPFEIMVLHVNPGFENQSHREIAQSLAGQGISAHLEIAAFGPEAHGEKNKKNSACFYCAMRRRRMLFDFCRKYKLTHLALGHNQDDMLDTFFLNFCRGGKVETLNISASFFNGNLQVIRPLLLVEKKYIKQAARQWKLPVWENPCPSSGHTARADADEITAAITAKIPGARRSMLNGLARWRLEKEER